MSSKGKGPQDLWFVHARHLHEDGTIGRKPYMWYLRRGLVAQGRIPGPGAKVVVQTALGPKVAVVSQSERVSEWTYDEFKDLLRTIPTIIPNKAVTKVIGRGAVNR